MNNFLLQFMHLLATFFMQLIPVSCLGIAKCILIYDIIHFLHYGNLHRVWTKFSGACTQLSICRLLCK